MTVVGQALRVTTALADVLPRSVTALRASGSWEPLSLSGIRQLGIAGAYAEPETLRIKMIRRCRAGLLPFEQLTYKHDPVLPAVLATADLAGPATAVCPIPTPIH